MMNRTGDVDGRAAYPWPFFAVMMASLLLSFSFQALFPISPLYIAEVGGSPADNGVATWVFALAALLTRPLAGFLADRWGRKPVLVVGAGLFGIGPLLHAFAFDVGTLLVVKAAHGIGLAAFSTAYPPFVADLLPPGRYGEGLGLAGMPSSLAMVIAPLFGEWALRTLGFQLSFRALGAIGGLGMVATLVLLGSRRGPTLGSPAGGSGLREALDHRGVRTGALAMALMAIPLGAFVTFIPLLADSREIGGIGLVYAVFALASTAARPLAGRAADRWGPRPAVAAGLGLACLAAGAMAVAHVQWLLMVAALILGVGFGIAGPALDGAVQGGVKPSLRGAATAIQYTAFDALVGFGGLGLGALANAAGYGLMYVVVSAIVLVGLLTGLLIKMPEGSRAPR